MAVKVLGIDLGEKRVGVAISDALGMFAHPLVTLTWKNEETFINDIEKLAKENAVEKIVVGVPYTMKGTRSAKTEEVLEIIEIMRNKLKIQIIEIDERLTTKMAEQAFLAVGKKSSKNRHKIDQVAASYILQSYLDSIK
jgi:putative Holliday junction resolvase